MLLYCDFELGFLHGSPGNRACFRFRKFRLGFRGNFQIVGNGFLKRIPLFPTRLGGTFQNRCHLLPIDVLGVQNGFAENFLFLRSPLRSAAVFDCNLLFVSIDYGVGECRFCFINRIHIIPANPNLCGIVVMRNGYYIFWVDLDKENLASVGIVILSIFQRTAM